MHIFQAMLNFCTTNFFKICKFESSFSYFSNCAEILNNKKSFKICYCNSSFSHHSSGAEILCHTKPFQNFASFYSKDLLAKNRFKQKLLFQNFWKPI